MKLAGKVALITGASPNIMGGIAEGMADEGAKIVAVDIRPDYAEQCAEAIRKRGGEAISIVCDVTDPEQVKAAVTRAREAFAGIDILVNGAVIQNRKGIREITFEEWKRQTSVILDGTFLFTKYVAELMIEQGRKGCIINLAATDGQQGNPRNVGYGTGKGGILNFTRCVAMELAAYGIRVNSLTPTGTDPSEGLERTARWGVQLDRPLPTPDGARLPLGRAPRPSDYARAAVFLASDDAEMITGFDLRVDGGAVARYWGWDPATIWSSR